MSDLEEQQSIQKQINALEAFIKPHLSKEALVRYSNLKIAHPDIAIKSLAIIAQVIEKQNITIISDDQFKELLKLIDAGKRKTKITF
ncbi:hypothetical protein HYV79_01825 [Candidatus Woesearchaeota archaeon]|nr:hypothetical protein [Candidatus Woesearchaeota archaeon]